MLVVVLSASADILAGKYVLCRTGLFLPCFLGQEYIMLAVACLHAVMLCPLSTYLSYRSKLYAVCVQSLCRFSTGTNLWDALLLSVGLSPASVSTPACCCAILALVHRAPCLWMPHVTAARLL
eukprot:GHUV01049998.1.p2 GENE.GHUV01049998.1~~GHUV01049998.1.p2  ORF type:complete len:123 (-),score=11.71 GHUV01049998.1:187-555(-)